MIVYCTVCEREDFPETEEFGINATARDHLRIWHPDEWARVDVIGERCVITPSGEKAERCVKCFRPLEGEGPLCVSCWGDNIDGQADG